MLEPIIAISPIDGRYRSKTEPLSDYFSEFGLIKYRILTEVKWLIYVCNTVKLKNTRVINKDEIKLLEELVSYFDTEKAKEVKEIERETNHDVKAVEYFLKKQLKETSLKDLTEFIHFACTSEDINNISYALMIRDARDKVMKEELLQTAELIAKIAKDNHSTPLLSLTHGQSASPTTIGKEFVNVLARLDIYIEKSNNHNFTAKINGATGNFNAHIASSDNDWPKLNQQFIESLGLSYNPLTTQIEPHDNLAEFLNLNSQINTILIDFTRDIWSYIQRGIFKQKVLEGEVGSSTMPHKVNPIDFENAEGNLGLANSIIAHLSYKLPISRMQRDLTDSTVLRNLGIVFGYQLIAIKSLIKGLNKLEVNEKIIKDEFDKNPEVLAEAIQTVMRLEGIDSPYEKLKQLTRGKEISLNKISKFIDDLDLDKKVKDRLKKLTPSTYTGLASELTLKYLKNRK